MLKLTPEQQTILAKARAINQQFRDAVNYDTECYQALICPRCGGAMTLKGGWQQSTKTCQKCGHEHVAP